MREGLTHSSGCYPLLDRPVTPMSEISSEVLFIPCLLLRLPPILAGDIIPSRSFSPTLSDEISDIGVKHIQAWLSTFRQSESHCALLLSLLREPLKQINFLPRGNFMQWPFVLFHLSVADWIKHDLADTPYIKEKTRELLVACSTVHPKAFFQ